MDFQQMSADFRREEANYWKQLPEAFNGAKLLIEMQGRDDRLPDWQLVAEFEAFLLREAQALKSKVQAPLAFLATQTGWFTAAELVSSRFEWAEVTLLHDVSELAKKTGGEAVYELWFDMEAAANAWVDTYGAWIATFQGLALTGLRREQT